MNKMLIEWLNKMIVAVESENKEYPNSGVTIGFLSALYVFREEILKLDWDQQGSILKDPLNNIITFLKDRRPKP